MNILKTTKYAIGAPICALFMASCAEVPKPTRIQIQKAFLDHVTAVYKEDSIRFAQSDSVAAKYALEHLPKDANDIERYNAQRKVDIATGKVLEESKKRVLYFQHALDSVKNAEAKKAQKTAKIKK